MDFMLQPLRKYADFSGRARRREYWLFALGLWIVEVILLALTGGFANPEHVNILSCVVLVLLGLGLFVPSVAVGFRRLHDTNRSAWWLLIGFLPIIGPIVLLVFLVLDGTPGDNRFGPDPKEPQQADPTPAASIVS